MKLTKEKKEVFWILALALFLHAIAEQNITKNSSGYYEGSGLIIGAIGLTIWVFGMMKYARSKGRSELLAIILALFWIPGLIILMLLQDIKKSGSLKSIK